MCTGVKTERTAGDVSSPDERRCSAEARESAEERDGAAASDVWGDIKYTNQYPASC